MVKNPPELLGFHQPFFFFASCLTDVTLSIGTLEKDPGITHSLLPIPEACSSEVWVDSSEPETVYLTSVCVVVCNTPALTCRMPRNGKMAVLWASKILKTVCVAFKCPFLDDNFSKRKLYLINTGNDDNFKN